MIDVYIPWDEFPLVLHSFNCPCCLGVKFMPDKEELEQFVTEQIDGERLKEAMLSIDLEQMRKAIEQTKAVGK